MTNKEAINYLKEAQSHIDLEMNGNTQKMYDAIDMAIVKLQADYEQVKDTTEEAMKNIEHCFKWYRKFPYSEEYENYIKYIVGVIESWYGKVLCDLPTLCKLWMDFSNERYSTQFIKPDSGSITGFVSWAKAKCAREYEDEDYEDD